MLESRAEDVVIGDGKNRLIDRFVLANRTGSFQFGAIDCTVHFGDVTMFRNQSRNSLICPSLFVSTFVHCNWQMWRLHSAIFFAQGNQRSAFC